MPEHTLAPFCARHIGDTSASVMPSARLTLSAWRPAQELPRVIERGAGGIHHDRICSAGSSTKCESRCSGRVLGKLRARRDGAMYSGLARA